MDSNEIIKRVRERVYREVKKKYTRDAIWILVFKMYYIIVQKHI